MPVDELDQCNQIVGKDDNHTTMGGKHLNVSTKTPMVQDGSKPKKYFPFKQGNPFVATLRVGSEGIQMTVDGKHITSFGFREVGSFFFSLCSLQIVQHNVHSLTCLSLCYFQTLEPWLINEVRIAGNIKLISVLTSGLPT